MIPCALISVSLSFGPVVPLTHLKKEPPTNHRLRQPSHVFDYLQQPTLNIFCLGTISVSLCCFVGLSLQAVRSMSAATVSSILVSPARRSYASSCSAEAPQGQRSQEVPTADMNTTAAPSVMGFAHSSPFLRSSRLKDVPIGTPTRHQQPCASSSADAAVETIIPNSMQLTSPARWTDTLNHASPTTTTLSSAMHTTMSQTYQKDYDYTQPNVSMLMHRNAAAEGSAVDDERSGKKREVALPVGPIVLRQREYSGQVRRAQEEAALRASTSQGSPRDLLYKGLPYTWRELVPFSCPVNHPELMSYDPAGYHSAVAKQTRDIGMRMIDLQAGQRHRSLEGLDLNVERGVTGLSLNKHVTAHRMQQLNSYPGITNGLYV